MRLTMRRMRQLAITAHVLVIVRLVFISLTPVMGTWYPPRHPYSQIGIMTARRVLGGRTDYVFTYEGCVHTVCIDVSGSAGDFPFHWPGNDGRIRRPRGRPE